MSPLGLRDRARDQRGGCSDVNLFEKEADLPTALQFTFRFALAGAVSALAFAQSPGVAQSPACRVQHQPFMQGGVARGTMRVVNDGRPCGFTFRFAGQFDPSTWKVEQAPAHGQVEAGGSRVEYMPEPGYAGPDAFTVAVFGTNPMRKPGFHSRDGRFAIEVDVEPAH
jgi:hypothetical protein